MAVWRHFWIILALTLTGAEPALAERYKYTYPQPPKIKPADPMRVFPGSEVPQFPERYVWKTKRGKASSAGAGDGTVKTYDFDFFGKGSAAGTVPEGTEIKLEQFRMAGRTLFYGLMVDGKQKWVSGHDIVATAYAPPAK